MDRFNPIERNWSKTSSASALSQIDPVDPGLIFILDYWTCAPGYDSGEEEEVGMGAGGGGGDGAGSEGGEGADGGLEQGGGGGSEKCS